MYLKPNKSFGYVPLQLLQRGHINDLFCDCIEEQAKLYDWDADLWREDTMQGNREQLSHNDMTVMGLHTSIVELEFSYIHQPLQIRTVARQEFEFIEERNKHTFLSTSRSTTQLKVRTSHPLEPQDATSS